MMEQKTKSWFFTDREIEQMGARKWPAHLTLEQQKAQLRHEIEKGIAPR